MQLYYSICVLIVIASLFAYLNKRFIKLPSSIGIMVITIVFSMLIVATSRISETPMDKVESVLRHVDFSDILMTCMLNFLLFAGAIRIDLKRIKEEKLMIVILSSLSVVISSLVVGFAMYYGLKFGGNFLHLDIQVPLIYCLLFGALISPTDAVAVLEILKNTKISERNQIRISGESLFNDGVSVVLYTFFLHLSLQPSHMDISWEPVVAMLGQEIFGGIALGLLLGWIGWYGIRTACDYKITVLITLSIVMGGYLVVKLLDISAPLTMVTAGLFIGYQRGVGYTKSSFKANTNVDNFWSLLDTILNAFLFMFMGFEILVIDDLSYYWMIGLLAIFVVILARYISIVIPVKIIPFKSKVDSNSIFLLVWGGLRGGISVALSLSLPQSEYREFIIAVTYIVVVFSVIVQGLSLSPISRRMGQTQDATKGG